jgi:hypothetical protein
MRAAPPEQIHTRIGIDSGVTAGALAVRYEESGRWLIEEMPVVNGVIDCESLKKFLLANANPQYTKITVEDISTVAITKANQRKFLSGDKGGAASSNLGVQLTEYGAILGTLRTLGYYYQLITPTTWQDSAGKKNKSDKAESIIKAVELYPEVRTQLIKKTTYHDGKAEAVLILHHQYMSEQKPKGGKKSGKSN